MGEDRKEGEDADRRVAELEAERLEMLEAAARSVFRRGGSSGRALDEPALEKFLHHHGGEIPSQIS